MPIPISMWVWLVSGRATRTLNVTRLRPRSRRGHRLARRGLEKGEQIGVELVFVRGGKAVRRPLVDLELCALDELRLEKSRVGDRHDLVVVALDDQSWNVELLEVISLVGLGECLNAVVCGFEANRHGPQPEHVPNAL